MSDYEIDAGPGLAAPMVEAVPGGGETWSQRTGRCLTAPKIAHRVAEFVVPLGPARREAPNLVAARTAIPRLCDQLHGGEYRVLAAGLQEPALVVKAVRLARQDGAEIKAKAIHMGLRHPIAEAVGDHLDHPHMTEVEGVSSAGIVDIVARLIGHEPVVGSVVDALER